MAVSFTAWGRGESRRSAAGFTPAGLARLASGKQWEGMSKGSWVELCVSDPEQPTQWVESEIHPLVGRPELVGRTHHVCRSNRTEGAKPQWETETEGGSVRPQ